MNYTLPEYFWLFIVYSVFGWLIETVYTAIKEKRFINRGILNGPLCMIYGLSAVIMSLVLGELSNRIPFLFLGSAIIATLVEWIAGHLLERITHQKWWDYSKQKWNIDGYICLLYSVIWGILGVLAVKYINWIIVKPLQLLPSKLTSWLLWVIYLIITIDFICSFSVILKLANKNSHLNSWNRRVLTLTSKIGWRIVDIIEKRVTHAYQISTKSVVKPAKSDTFAAGCGFYKLFWLFFIGAFIGAIVEMNFCRLTMGYWMSRSSLVWGQFSVVWGIGIALLTGLTYRYKNSSDRTLFLIGTVLGGLFEYLCSVFTEIAFGTVFWDYSKIPFNLGGRINLLFCFFWGIAADVWFKLLYPHISDAIEKIPKKIGITLTWILFCFMFINISVSGLALSRYNQRAEGIPASNLLTERIDTYFPDHYMSKVYPSAKKR